MTSFIDSKNRTWNLSLTLGSCRRVFDVLGVDLLNPSSIDATTQTPISVRLIYDDLFLATVVSELIAPQLKDASIDKEVFYDSLDASTLKRLSEAFFEEYERFFTERGRDVWTKAIRKDRATAKENAEKAISLLGDESLKLPEERDLSTGKTIPFLN